MAEKRRTWKDRKRGSVGMTFDCILLSGTRYTVKNDPFHPIGSRPERVVEIVVRDLAIMYGWGPIEAACARGLKAARSQPKAKAAPSRLGSREDQPPAAVRVEEEKT